MATPPTPHISLILFFFKYYKMYRNAYFYAQYAQGSKSSGAKLLLLLGMMLLLLVIALVVVIILKSRKKKKQQRRNLSDLSESLREHQENMYRAAEELDIDPDDLKAELFESSNLVCYVYPENGSCDANFYDLRDGCCELRSNAGELADQARKDMALDMTTMILMSVLPEIILTDILPRLLSSPRLGLVVGRLRNLGAKMFSKIMAKGIARTAIKAATSMAVKAAAMVTKLLIKLGSGPVGWALLVFDIFTVIQDLADTNNYNTFLENKMNMETRDIIVYEFAKAMTMEKMDFPVLFPFSLLFPEESETAMLEYNSKIMLDYIEILLEVEGGTEWFIDMLVTALEAEESGEDPPPTTQEDDQKSLEIMDTFFSRVRQEHGQEVDKFLFDTMQSLIPSSRKNDLVLIPGMSSEKTIGIGISEEAAERWNQSKRDEWFTYLDPFFPPNIPTADWVPPMVATHTDVYLTPNKLNPGTSNAPNIVTATLPQKVTLMYPFGTLITFCEKERTTASYKMPIDPTDYDVTFDPIPGVCNFTERYCQRYGLDFENKTWKDGTSYTDCDLSEGQEGAEMIFGTENVRQAKLWVEDPDQAAANQSQQVFFTLQRRNEEHGPVGALLLTAVDPTGMFENFGRNFDDQLAGRDKYCVTGDTCKEFHVKHRGGNFMGWSARDSSGQVYSNGQGFQNQVKHGEDHTFFVPEGGYFRVKCDPGESMNVPYEDIENPLQFSCWWGKVKRDPTGSAFGDSAKDFFEEDAGPAIQQGLAEAAEFTVETAVPAVADFFEEEVAEPFVEWGNEYKEEVKEDCGSGGNAGDCLETVFTLGFSDRRLKKDVKKSKLKSPIPGLDLYTWTWNEIAMSTYGLKGRDFGFIADEIQDEYISKDVYGYEYIKKESPIHKALVKLKSKYSVKQ